MTIIEGKHNGFCFGVSSAVKKAEESLALNKPVFTLGPLIHNKLEIKRLEQLGIKSVDSIDEVPKDGVIVIRSHGVPPSVMNRCRCHGATVIDATCPFVQRIQKIVNQAHRENKKVIIAGNADRRKRFL